MKTLILALMLIFSTVAFAEYYPAPEYRVFGEPHSAADKTDIDELIEAFTTAWAEEDAAAVAAVHSDDAEWINAFGRTYRGNQVLEEFLESGLFPAFDSEISRREMETFQVLSRRYIGADGAVLNTIMDSDRGSSVGAGSRRVSLNLVLEKIDGEWKIVHQVITDLREMRSSN
tara:strand:+ start:58 stop:576 length:519 start_codon:yes stop_codon:yes gene_type:complete